MATVAVVFLILMAFAVLVVGRVVWRLVRGNERPEAAGSFGWQFFGGRDKATKPEDWLNK